MMNDETGHAIDWPVEARPTVKLAGRFPLADRDFGFVYHSQIHALHLHEYAGRIRMAARTFTLSPGTMTFSRAGADSAYDLPEAGFHWCIHLNTPGRQRASSSSRKTLALPCAATLGHRQHEAAGRFSHIARMHALAMRATSPGHRAAAQAACSNALQDLLLWYGLLQDFGQNPQDKRHHQAIDELLDIIERKLHQPLSMPELAQQAGLSQNYLAKLFRQRMGMTIPRYLLTRRMEMAKLLLATTSWPVKRIASRVGMPDAQHFNKQYRRIIGVSPTQSRQGE